jgi:uncharacterized protein
MLMLTSVRTAAAFAALLLSACSKPADAPVAEPPPLPEGAATADFEAAADPSTPQRPASEYWGLEPGEALPIIWGDLLPAGAEEELARQQAEFYAMLEQRYQANATSLYEADPLGTIAEGSEMDYMPQFGTFDTVEDFDGMRVRIPGYVVPFDFNPKKTHTEFLFVPYMGACIHTPPPPPNQIIFVRADKGVKIDDIWVPYYVEGTFGRGEFLNDTGDAAYSIDLAKLEPYPYP